MNRFLLVLLLLGLGRPALAHRLDECLQAIRLTVRPGGVALSALITPGAEVAGPFLAVVDRDGDGALSNEESRAYAKRWLGGLVLQADGRVMTLKLGALETPTPPAVRRGVGVFRLDATAQLPILSDGPHQLYLVNRNLPDLSVYLVNAVKPADDAVVLLKQTRNQRQTEYRLDFLLKSPGSGGVPDRMTEDGAPPRVPVSP